MKIVVVDHVYLEDRHIKRLRSLGDLEVFKDPPENQEELKKRTKDADIVVVGWTNLTREVINSADRLKMISIWATTCHYVDLEAARERRIVVTHVPGYASESVAEFTFALMLAAIRKLVVADKHVRGGEFDWRPFGGKELAEKTLGVVGTGAIGFRVAEIAQAFKMHVLGFDKYPNYDKAEEIGLKYVDLETLLSKSNIVTIHVTLTSETERLIGKDAIALMKADAVLVNTSQGRIIDENALVEALRTKKIAFAALDVLEAEPPPRDMPLFEFDNVVFSPHIGFNTDEAKARCSDICVDNVVKFLEGKHQNVC